MPVQLRKITKATIFYQSEIATVDMDDFKNHEDKPFEGSTEEEFLEYLKSFDLDNTEGLSDETIDELQKIFDPVLTEYYNTASDFEESELEIGEEDPKCRKAGGFFRRESIQIS
jgi:hypothetical protein